MVRTSSPVITASIWVPVVGHGPQGVAPLDADQRAGRALGELLNRAEHLVEITRVAREKPAH